MRTSPLSSIGTDYAAEILEIKQTAEKLREEQPQIQEYGFSPHMLKNITPQNLENTERGYKNVISTLKHLPEHLKSDYEQSPTVELLISQINALRKKLISNPGYKNPLRSPKRAENKGDESGYVEILPSPVNEAALRAAHESYERAKAQRAKEQKDKKEQKEQNTTDTDPLELSEDQLALFDPKPSAGGQRPSWSDTPRTGAPAATLPPKKEQTNTPKFRA